MPIRLSLAITCALLAAISSPGQDYTFTLDGKPFTPAGVTLQGTAGKWAEGDIIFVEGLAVTLGKPGGWAFGTRRLPEGVLTLQQDGKEVPVALDIDSKYSKDGDSHTLNPLPELTATERAGLRGLRIQAPIGNIKDGLRGVPGTQLALILSDGCLTNGETRLPELPTDLHWLTIDESSNQGFQDLKSLASLTSLRGLRLRLMTVPTFDASVLGGLQSLRSFDYYGAPLRQPEALGRLINLRELDIAFNDELRSVDWCRGLPKLEKIRLVGTAVNDLSPLADLPALREISAQFSKVTTMGDGPFPALTRLNVLATPMSSDAAAAFQKAHPKCVVLRNYRDSLIREIKDATRVRIRSGGTCHRQEDKEVTLTELKAPEEIAALMELLVFEEGKPPFHCMCCGDPSLEFYAGDRLIATLGFHHGEGMRWPAGPWPGDVHLLESKAMALCEWLEQRGVRGAGEELRQAARQKAALKRRQSLYQSLLPKTLSTALESAESADQAAKLFVDTLPDAKARTHLVFSLYGCSQDSWNIAAGMDEFLTETLLPKITPDEIAQLAQDPSLTAAARRGLARWMFEEEKWELLTDEARAKHLASLAHEGLTSPRAHNRQRTLLELSRIGTPEAVNLLRRMLAGEFKPASLSAEETDEPGGMVSYKPNALELPDDAPDSAHAAALLLRLKDASSAAAVEEALARMPAEWREKVRNAATSED